MIIANVAKRILRPFAALGARADIPASQSDATRASYEQGFPALNMTPIAAGGVPPSGQDFNGILYDVSNAALWQQAAGILPWSAEFAQSAVSNGYPKNALVVYNATLYQSTVDNNQSEPGVDSNWQGVGVAKATQPQHAVTLQQFLAESAKYAPLLNPIFKKQNINIEGGRIILQAADNQPYRDLCIDFNGSAVRFFAARKADEKFIGATIDLDKAGEGLFDLLSEATTTQKGLMSSADKQWLDWFTKDTLPEISPTGMVAYFPYTFTPKGWLPCNGAAISRTSYAQLFTNIGVSYGVGNGSTTFNLPDLRGEFIRVWDAGRGIDPGRVLGSWQADELKSHMHNVPLMADYGGAPNDNQVIGDNATLGLRNTGTSFTGGSETRPRNIALHACIKY